jgi:glycerol kinase
VSLLLGIDEGTSAVKAVLYDADRLEPITEARREKPLAQPQPGRVEQDPEVTLAAVVDAVAEVLERAPGKVDACGLDHQGESVLAWDANSGTPITPIVTWQDKRSGEIIARLEMDGSAEEVARLSGMPLDPYFSAGKVAWLLEPRERFGSGPSTRFCATGSGLALAQIPPPLRGHSWERPSGIRNCLKSSAYRGRYFPRSSRLPATLERWSTRRGDVSCR